jgi:hypothetical protein
MPVSFAAVTPTNLELTPVRISYDGVDLGASLGNVKVNVKYDKAELKADQFGTSIIDRVNSGLNVTVETELAEFQNKDIIKVVFPNMVELTSGPNKAAYFVSKVGEHDLSLAKQLILHPLSKQDADFSGDWLFYQAVANGDSSVTYGPQEQIKLKLIWNVYLDTSVQPARFCFHGDPSIGVVNAVAAAAVAGSNTGNGTISAEVAYNGFTVTETITVLCVGSTSGNDFYVSGSVSGPLGEVHVAAANLSTVNFVSDQITFTINQGSTQFITGDSFTIATTGANYA